jgi:hypothetical protein
MVAARLGHPLGARPDADLRLAAPGLADGRAVGVLGVPNAAAIEERLGASLRPG